MGKLSIIKLYNSSRSTTSVLIVSPSENVSFFCASPMFRGNSISNHL